MKKKAIYTYIAASLAFLVPPPGRFVYGLVLVIQLLFLMFVGTCFFAFINKFGLVEIETPLNLIVLICCTIFYKQVFIIFQTEIALTLGFDFYLPAVSAFLIGYIHNKTEETFTDRLIKNMKSAMYFSLFALCFFLFRDIAGYGTFTFFGSNHNISEIIILKQTSISIFSFFASIPGALILCSAILALYIFVNKKMRIIDRKNKIFTEEE